MVREVVGNKEGKAIGWCAEENNVFYSDHIKKIALISIILCINQKIRVM
jgi:hypothetical protein